CSSPAPARTPRRWSRRPGSAAPWPRGPRPAGRRRGSRSCPRRSPRRPAPAARPARPRPGRRPRPGPSPTPPWAPTAWPPGPPGEVAAGRCADGGLAVALVERELVGGECTYWACVPSKTLIRPGDVLAAARRVPGAAEAVTGRLDAAAAFAQRDYMTSDWND